MRSTGNHHLDGFPRLRVRTFGHVSMEVSDDADEGYHGQIFFVPEKYADRLRRAVASFNAIMQEPDAPAPAERSPEERALAEAGYMPVSEYVERNS